MLSLTIYQPKIRLGCDVHCIFGSVLRTYMVRSYCVVIQLPHCKKTSGHAEVKTRNASASDTVAELVDCAKHGNK
jgi:hypothetical protein